MAWGDGGGESRRRLRAVVGFWARVISVSAGAAGTPLCAACVHPFSPCVLSKNVSTGCAGPYLVKGTWWRGERACLRDAPPILGNFLGRKQRGRPVNNIARSHNNVGHHGVV